MHTQVPIYIEDLPPPGVNDSIVSIDTSKCHQGPVFYSPQNIQNVPTAIQNSLPIQPMVSLPLSSPMIQNSPLIQFSQPSSGITNFQDVPFTISEVSFVQPANLASASLTSTIRNSGPVASTKSVTDPAVAQLRALAQAIGWSMFLFQGGVGNSPVVNPAPSAPLPVLPIVTQPLPLPLMLTLPNAPGPVPWSPHIIMQPTTVFALPTVAAQSTFLAPPPALQFALPTTPVQVITSTPSAF